MHYGVITNVIYTSHGFKLEPRNKRVIVHLDGYKIEYFDDTSKYEDEEHDRYILMGVLLFCCIDG